jgi:hypothetical protein
MPSTKTKKVVALCKGKTVKGESCTRKGLHDGYCYQHDPKKEDAPNVDKPKVVKVTKPKVAKADKPKVAKPTKSGHIPFRGMIGMAISAADSDNRKGASRVVIKKYLYVNFKVPETHHMINSTIKKMIEKGELVTNQHHAGHFRLSPTFKPVIEDLRK